jgi:hypothetical protein
MSQIRLILLILFSLTSTACITTPRPTVVLGQPPVIYRGPNQNARVTTTTVVVVNNVAGVLMDIEVDNTVIHRNVATGVSQAVTFSCNNGFITITLGNGGRVQRAQFTITAKAHLEDGTYVGLARGPMVNLNCSGQPRQDTRDWQVNNLQVPRPVRQ